MQSISLISVNPILFISALLPAFENSTFLYPTTFIRLCFVLLILQARLLPDLHFSSMKYFILDNQFIFLFLLPLLLTSILSFTVHLVDWTSNIKLRLQRSHYHLHVLIQISSFDRKHLLPLLDH